MQNKGAADAKSLNKTQKYFQKPDMPINTYTEKEEDRVKGRAASTDTEEDNDSGGNRSQTTT